MALLTSHWILDGTLILLSLLFAAYLYMTRNFKYWTKKGVAEISPKPFVGNFLDILLTRTSAGEFLKNLYDGSEGLQYLGFYVFDKPALLLRDPAIVKNVLIKDFDCFSNRYAASNDHDALGTANLFTLRNPHWKYLRNKITPIFSPGMLKKMSNLIITVTDDLETHLETLSLNGEGQVVELKEICAKFSTDSIATCAFGLRVNSLNKPNAEFREYGRQIYAGNYKRSIELGTIFFAPALAKLMRSTLFGKEPSDFLRKAFGDTISSRIQSGQRRNDLIDILIELRDAQARGEGDDPEIFKFDGDNLAAQAAVFFSAGFESTATLMSFTMYELALQTDLQTRLRNEINSAFEENGGRLSYEMAMNLPYLHMVVSETLRKYPSLPLLDRVAVRDYKVPGTDLVIEKGTPVYIPIFGLHYDPQYFPEPHTYDPERFRDENVRKRLPCLYMPFGEGPRTCIASRFGLLQSKLGLITILSKYKVSTCDETQIPMLFAPKAMFLQSLSGIYLNMRKIEA